MSFFLSKQNVALPLIWIYLTVTDWKANRQRHICPSENWLVPSVVFNPLCPKAVSIESQNNEPKESRVFHSFLCSILLSNFFLLFPVTKDCRPLQNSRQCGLRNAGPARAFSWKWTKINCPMLNCRIFRGLVVLCDTAQYAGLPSILKSTFGC